MSIGTARRARIRPFLMAATAVFALLANLAALIAGVTVVFPHLLYIPIVLAGYWYPRRGPVISAIISATYAVMALALTPQDWISIVSRAITLVAIGVLIAFISHQLEAERVRYRELFDHSVAGILVVNGAGVILKANQQAATLVGRDEGELVGTPLASISDDPGVTTAFLAASARSAVNEVALDLIHAERRPVHCIVSGAPLRPDRIVVTLADMSEGRKARDALEAANQTMTSLAMILDRDLTRDVVALDACVEQGREVSDDPETLAILDRIHDGLAGVTRRIAISREFRLLGTRSPVWQSAGSAFDEARRRLGPTAVTIRADLDGLEVYADPSFPAALFELLHNATRPGIGTTHIEVTANRSPDGCMIVVADNGRGLAPEERDNLFSFSEDRCGRGLFLAHEILGLTGIGIAEEGARIGARFVLSIPPGSCRDE